MRKLWRAFKLDAMKGQVLKVPREWGRASWRKEEHKQSAEVDLGGREGGLLHEDGVRR